MPFSALFQQREHVLTQQRVDTPSRSRHENVQVVAVLYPLQQVHHALGDERVLRIQRHQRGQESVDPVRRLQVLDRARLADERGIGRTGPLLGDTLGLGRAPGMWDDTPCARRSPDK